VSGLRLGLLALGLAALAGAAGLWWRARTGRARSGLPRGEVVYADTAGWMAAESLWAPRYHLTGKPDYLVREGRALVPVEVKPGRHASTPYDGDVMQLAAYCLLAEEALGERPPYGLLRYAEHTFRIPYDEPLRQALLDVLDGMRADLTRSDVERSHDDAVRCRRCGLREDCGQAVG
jgi:CRISPR-associated exonuclease Cas4